MYAGKKHTFWLKMKFILKETKYTLVQGCKDLAQDTKWIINLIRRKHISQFTGDERTVSYRIITDLLKFIPYSILVIIPGAEILIPAVIWLFPNAVPSFFEFDTANDKKIEILQQSQEEGYQFLIEKLIDVLREDFNKE